MGQPSQITGGAAYVGHREGRVIRVGAFVKANRIDSLFFIGREDEVSCVDGHEDLLPGGVVKTTADKHPFPFIK